MTSGHCWSHAVYILASCPGSQGPGWARCSQISHAGLETPGNLRGYKLRDSSSGLMSLSRNTSSSRLPNHFVSLQSNVDSCEAGKPKINRAQSLRTPRYYAPSDSNATRTAANYLKSMLPKKMSEDYKSPFGYNR